MSLSLIIDIAVILILLVSAGVSFFRGFVREVLTIFGVIGGFLAALFFGKTVAPLFRGWFGVVEGKEPEKLFDMIPYSIVADVCAYAGIFLAVFLILQLVSYFMSASVKAVGLGPVDRTLGVVFGLARGVLLLGILYLPFHLILPEENKKDWFGHSQTFAYVEGVSKWLQSFLPAGSDDKAEDAKDKADDFTTDKLKEIDSLKDGLKEKTEDFKDKAQEKVDELKNKTDSGYSRTERKSLDNLIDQNETEITPPANTESTTPNE